MATNEYPVYNGIVPSWCDIQATAQIEGGVALDLPHLQSINTGCEVEIGEVEAGGRVIARTTGSSKHSASMQLTHRDYQEWLRKLAAVAPTRGNQKVVGLVHVNLQILWTPPGTDDIYEVRVKGCRFSGRDLNSAKGTDPNMVDVKLNPIQVVDVVDGQEVVVL